MSVVATIFLIKMIEAALGGFIFATVMMLTILCFDQMANWFRSRTRLKESDVDNLAFSLHSTTEVGEFSTIYGIYNLRKETVVEAESIRSKKVDGGIQTIHKVNKVVIYE